MVAEPLGLELGVTPCHPAFRLVWLLAAPPACVASASTGKSAMSTRTREPDGVCPEVLWAHVGQTIPAGTLQQPLLHHSTGDLHHWAGEPQRRQEPRHPADGLFQPQCGPQAFGRNSCQAAFSGSSTPGAAPLLAPCVVTSVKGGWWIPELRQG